MTQISVHSSALVWFHALSQTSSVRTSAMLVGNTSAYLVADCVHIDILGLK